MFEIDLQFMDSKNKREKKKQKIEEKEAKLFKPPHRKMHFEECQIPPYSQEHLRALLLQYLAYNQFECPVHHLTIFNRIRSFYQNFQNADIYLKDLDIPAILKQIQRQQMLNKIVIAQEHQRELLERAWQPQFKESIQKEHDKPSIAPPDPITFQQQRKELSAQEKENKQIVDTLLNAPSLFGENINIDDQLKDFSTYEERIELELFKKKKNIEYCDHCTRDRCQKAKGHSNCTKKHFRAIITQNTDESYGNCPHLNACHNPDCKLTHYVQEDQQNQTAMEKALYRERVSKAEWVNCDLRYFDFKILGKFAVIMADPPWDIHMSLPYGTLKDKELLNLRVDYLQDQGLIFLWVTGRAMELGRQCLIKWGYKRVDEIVWIKTNQINRLIITGKTGHWLNHTKEHCLVGIKGDPKIHSRLDCDVIVSKVRETSRKPDEIYGVIERMSPGTKKIELFGRPDNCMPGWLTLGNQLTDVRLKDKDIIARYQKAYPNHDLSEEKMEMNLQEMVNQDNLHKIYNNHIQKNTGVL